MMPLTLRKKVDDADEVTDLGAPDDHTRLVRLGVGGVLLVAVAGLVMTLLGGGPEVEPMPSSGSVVAPSEEADGTASKDEPESAPIDSDGLVRNPFVSTGSGDSSGEDQSAPDDEAAPEGPAPGDGSLLDAPADPSDDQIR